MNIAQIKDKVDQIVMDKAAKLEWAERDDFIQEAVKTYSKHRPRVVVKDITGDGTYDYAVSTNLTYWDDGLSVIKNIEYPADQREPEYVDEDDWLLYEKTTGKVIRFLKDLPQATEKIRVAYTALHQLTGALNTIPESDHDAFCNLAASLCSGALASIYAHASDTTIGADAVDHKSKSQEFSARAREQYKTYTRHMGLKDGDVMPASAVTDQGMNYPGGLDRLTHPRRQRQKR